MLLGRLPALTVEPADRGSQPVRRGGQLQPLAEHPLVEGLLLDLVRIAVHDQHDRQGGPGQVPDVPASSASRRSVSRSRTTTKTHGWRLLALPLQRATVSRSSSPACGTGTGRSVNRRTVRSLRKRAMPPPSPSPSPPYCVPQCRVPRDSLTFLGCGGSVPPTAAARPSRTASETAGCGADAHAANGWWISMRGHGASSVCEKEV